MQVDAQRSASVIARFILTGAEKDGDAQREAEQFGDILFTDDRLSGYRSIVHKTYFVLEYVVCTPKPGSSKLVYLNIPPSVTVGMRLLYTGLQLSQSNAQSPRRLQQRCWLDQGKNHVCNLRLT